MQACLFESREEAKARLDRRALIACLKALALECKGHAWAYRFENGRPVGVIDGGPEAKGSPPW